MLLSEQIIGRTNEARFAGRRIEWVAVEWAEASKRRLRRHTDAGTDVALSLPRGAYLADGAVVFDDGRRIVAVVRRAEPALIIRLDLTRSAVEVLDAAARIAHTFGNQHVPVEIEGDEIRLPLTTSAQIARDTVMALDLDGVTVVVAPVALGRLGPLTGGYGTHHHDLRQ